MLTEHVLFRSISWSRYDIDAWDKPHSLPRGYAAIVTFVASIGIIVVCMDQEWWVGPLALAGTGDIGMLVGFVSSILLYWPLRWVEIQWETRRY